MLKIFTRFNSDNSHIVSLGGTAQITFVEKPQAKIKSVQNVIQNYKY